MTSKRKLYREDEKLFFLHSYYQSGMSKHAFCRAHGICCPALLNSQDNLVLNQKYEKAGEKSLWGLNEES